MVSELHVLIVEDVEDDLVLLLRELRRGGYAPDYLRVDTADGMEAALDRQHWDMVIADYSLPAFSAPAALQVLQQRQLDLPFIIVSGTIGEEVAVAAMKAGAHDYIIKGNLARLVPAVKRELRDAEERQKRHSAEQALQESESRFRHLAEELHILSTALESAVEGIAQLDCQGRYLKVNTAYADLLGYHPEELISMTWQLTVHPDDRAKMELAYQQMLRQGKVEVEARGIRQDGAIFYQQLVMVNSYDHQQQSIGYYCFAKDITAAKRDEVIRKQTDQLIREQAALLDVATDAIASIDLDYRILFWNKGAERLYGWTAAEVMGKNAIELLHRPGEPLPPFDPLQTHPSSSNQWQGEFQHITKSGKNIIIEGRWTLVRDEFGQPKSILTIGTDITKKKQLESQFLRVQRLESLGTLASGIAHDFNNILTPILAASQLLPRRWQNMNGRDRQLIEMMENSAKRGADLVRQILAFASGVEGKRVSLQVRHLLAEVLQFVRQTFPKTIEIHRDIPATDLWTISADATQLHQVLMNLCVNARDAMPDGGILTIQATNRFIEAHQTQIDFDAPPGAYVTISVRDTGTGIPTELLDRIFDPFFTTKEVGKGTGLGLSTVLGIVNNHGGFITIDTEIGRGTEFQVYIPAISSSIAPIPIAPKILTGHQELILIVDDEVSIQEIAKTILEDNNYRTLTASSGSAAIELYAQSYQEIAVVLLDMMMPVMDGLTTVRALQSIYPQVKIVISSGLVSSERLAQFIEIGVRSFLAKPYTASELLDILQQVSIG